MGRVLLTGAAGLLGTRLRAWFTEHGRAYVGTDIRLPEQPDSAPFLLADLTDPKAVDALMEGIDTVVHFGGASKEVAWNDLLNGNIIGGYNVFGRGTAGGSNASSMPAPTTSWAFTRSVTLSTLPRRRAPARFMA